MIQEIANSVDNAPISPGRGIDSRRPQISSLLRSESAMASAVGGAVSELMGGSIRGAIATEAQEFVGDLKYYASKLSFPAKALSSLALGLGAAMVIVNGAAPSGSEPRQGIPIEPTSTPASTREPIIPISCIPLKNGRKDKQAGGPYELPSVGERLLKYREVLLAEKPTESQEKYYREVEARVGAERGSVRFIPGTRVVGDDQGCVVPLTEY